jgi:hypothetical protein
MSSSLSVTDQVSHQYKTTGKIMILNILILKVFWEDTWGQETLNTMVASIPKFNLLLISSWT